MQERKPYTYVRLIMDESDALDRYEVRTSTFVEWDEDPGRRAVTGKPSKAQALEIAKEIARRERDRNGE